MDQSRGVTSWQLRIPNGADNFGPHSQAEGLLLKAEYGSPQTEDGQSRKGMTPVSDAAGAYPWVVHVYSRMLKEAPTRRTAMFWAFEKGKQWEEFEWYIPTTWNQGSAFFIRDADVDHTQPSTARHQSDASMWEHRCLADSVFVVAWRKSANGQAPSRRISGWADTVSVPTSYYQTVGLNKRPFHLSRNNGRYDVAALRLCPGTGFPADLLGEIPHVAALPIKTLRETTVGGGAGTQGGPFPVDFAGVGGLVEYRTKPSEHLVSQLFFCRAPPTPGKSALAVTEFPSIDVTFEQMTDPTADETPEEAESGTVEDRFQGQLVVRSAVESVPHGISGGPGLLMSGGQGAAQQTYIVGCMNQEEELSQGSFRYGVSLFTDDAGVNSAADPRVLLDSVGCKGMKWEAVKINGWDCQRLV
ncbi:hypothetical protein C8A05DRAFT_39609 [Staphylotrichum tortipilum]|uniref:Uncharacterized protein n=1 Tax=Staphylotrichum tortipilum TaxID=2831512 RepID=A0AAN6MBC9_9PEZI|nr:hypothetical protein C8A05DRAFT_39609 [Staphylotrichum longicolle]